MCAVLIVSIIVLVKMSFTEQKAYLNYNSTASHEFNYSDLLYPDVEDERQGVEMIKSKVMFLVHAPANAKCIITSGSTEAIANCIKWAHDYIPSGIIVGSRYDHSAVKANALNNKMKYEQIDLSKDPLPDNTAAIFITHANGATGEYQRLNDITKNLNKTTYLAETPSAFIKDESRVLQYRPLIFLDATQSFMRLPINMEENNINGVFFSMHKLGGEQGLGFLIVSDYYKLSSTKIKERTNMFPQFNPLIAGEQQHGLRGGTLPLQHLLVYEDVFTNMDDWVSRENDWKRIHDKFKENGIKIIEPSADHLYSTFLIDVSDVPSKKCALSIINELAKKGIYIGGKSACAFEGGSSENVIRISFKEPGEISDNVLDEIIATINEKPSCMNDQ